MPDKISVEGA